jgi:hypothetical protein
MIPVVKKKNKIIIRLRGYAHKQQKKPRTQDFTWFSKSLHPRSAPALNSHYEINEYNSEELSHNSHNFSLLYLALHTTRKYLQ